MFKNLFLGIFILALITGCSKTSQELPDVKDTVKNNNGNQVEATVNTATNASTDTSAVNTETLPELKKRMIMKSYNMGLDYMNSPEIKEDLKHYVDNFDSYFAQWAKEKKPTREIYDQMQLQFEDFLVKRDMNNAKKVGFDKYGDYQLAGRNMIGDPEIDSLRDVIIAKKNELQNYFFSLVEQKIKQFNK